MHEAHHEHGYSDHKDALLKRLRRAEGQVRGIHRMIEDDTYCIDILTQISAVTSALNKVALGLVDDHLKHCVTHAIHDGSEDEAEAEAKIAEVSAAIARLVRI